MQPSSFQRLSWQLSAEEDVLNELLLSLLIIEPFLEVLREYLLSRPFLFGNTIGPTQFTNEYRNPVNEVVYTTVVE